MRDLERSDVKAIKKSGSMSQKWTIVYVDEYQETKDGELDKHYGFIAKKPFHLVSTLPDGRYLDIIGNQIVIKKRNGFNSQQWYWDPRTKSIKSVKTNSRSMTINGNGRHNSIGLFHSGGHWWQ
jgi:hypothetical protein